MANIEHEKVLVRKIYEIFQCAICLETVRRSVTQCVNGHMICAECEGDLDACPTCRGAFSDVSPTGIISQMVEALPTRCKFKNCGRYLEPKDDHEKYCDFRQTSCKIDGCNWEGIVRSVVDHLLQQHPDDIVVDNKEYAFTLNNFQPDISKRFFKGFSVEGNFFWHEIVNNAENRNFNHKFNFVPNKKPENDMFVKVWASSKEAKYMYKIKILLDDPDEEVNTLSVPKFMIPYFIDTEETLHYNVSFKIK